MTLQVLGSGSSGNCYIFKPSFGKYLVFDCGINFNEVKKAVDFNLDNICGVLQSHSHGDHSKYTKYFIKYGLDVYMSVDNKAEINIVSDRIKTVEHGEIFMVGDFKIMPFDIKHDVRCFGYLIEHQESGKYCVITDTYYCKYIFPDLNNIIIEANYSKAIIDKKYGAESGKEFLRNRILKSHFSLENCKEMLKANDLTKVNNIVLIHLSDTNSNEKQFQKEVFELTQKNVSVANKGMEIDFNKEPF